MFEKEGRKERGRKSKIEVREREMWEREMERRTWCGTEPYPHARTTRAHTM